MGRGGEGGRLDLVATKGLEEEYYSLNSNNIRRARSSG